MRYVATLFALFVIAAATPVDAATRTVKVTLALICDVYEMEEKGGRGGYARIAGAVKAERSRATNVIVAHAGDAISPSLMSSLDKGAHVMDLNNRIGFDIFVPGNHEFDFGPDIFRQRMAEAKIPLMAANLRDEQGNVFPGFDDTKMFEFEGVRIGVIGLTAENSVDRSSPGNLKFRSSLETVKELAPKLREQGADIVVAIAHAPRRVDFRLMRSGVIDVLLSGDDHDLVLVYDGDTAMVEAKQDGEYLTAVDLTFTVKEDGDRRRVKWWPRFRIVDTADVEPDTAVAARVAEYAAQLSSELDQPIGKTLTALDSRKSSVRRHEAAIGNLIADALRETMGADVAITNGGGIRGNKVYDAGSKLSRRDIQTELPFGNKAVMLELSGADLMKILENGLWYAGKANGRFPHVSGIKIIANGNKPGGEKIRSAMVAGKAIDPAAIYKVATNSFMASGREGNDAMQNGKVLIGENDGDLLATLVADFIAKVGEVSPKVEGRIVIE